MTDSTRAWLKLFAMELGACASEWVIHPSLPALLVVFAATLGAWLQQPPTKPDALAKPGSEVAP